MSSSAAVGAKTARACDYCIRRRARWYCTADDAFLCQACDGSVHSANALAGRHERVRLNTASLKPCIPSWHRGVHTRPRTARHGKKHHSKVVLHPSAHVPELGVSTTTTITTTTTTTTTSRDEDTDHLQCLYRVPVLDPFVSELCSSSAGESKYTELILFDCQEKECNNNIKNSHQQSFPLDLDMNLDMDMAEFAADVESLLGKGLDGEGYMIDELVKAEEEEETMPFELSFDYNSPGSTEPRSTNYDEKREWRMSLRLDYEAIRAAWARKGSPWMNGERPQINPNDCWLHSTMGGVGTVRALGGQGASGDGGREARVTRYREKRRTRLFSKKIRYEVRKLNAEKRPRMKGRFVKRSSFNPTPIAT